jgi:hypothetical protein
MSGGVLLRGAITRGMLWAAPNFTIGPVIARVHDMETKQNWAGFWFPIRLKDRKSEMGYAVIWPAIFRGSWFSPGRRNAISV